ncbi:MAG TPA: AAA family ATPase, partial [Polyangiaceae bacterium]
SYLLERQQQAAIIKASTLSKNRVLDLPEVPLREDSPKLPLRLASFLAGLVIGAAFVAIRSIWSESFQSASDVQRGACGVPVFGTIPLRQRKGSSARKSEGEVLLQALNDGPHSAFTESFRILRASLRHWLAFERGGVLLVTSPQSGDGKTTVVLSLAAVLAADGKRVLVIDADMTRATEPTTGGTLNAVLRGDCRWRQAVGKLTLPFTELFVIPAGGPARHDGSSYERRAKLLEDVRENFDFILIDSPSFPPAADALTWAGLADGVISIVRLGHTPRKVTTEHLTRLGNFAHAYAIVINDAGPTGRDRVASAPSPVPASELARLDPSSGRSGVNESPAYSDLNRLAAAVGVDTMPEQSRPAKRPPPWSSNGNG